MNTVFTQETEKYNILIKIMFTDLKNLIKVFKGLTLMNEEMESMGNKLTNNLIPNNWTEERGVG